MMTFETYELLSNYLNGSLSASERASLEMRLSQDATLQSQLEDLALIENVSIENKLAQVKALCKDEFALIKRHSIIKKTAYIAVGALILALATSFWLDSKKENDSPIEQESIETKNTILPSKKTTSLIIAQESTPEKAILKSPKQISANSSKQEHSLITEEKPEVVKRLEELLLLTPEKKKEMMARALILKDNPNLEKEKIALIDSCALNPMKISSQTQASCIGEKTGQVIVDIKNGYPPYNKTLRNSRNENLSFFNLDKGEYQLTIKDSKSCVQNLKVIIDSKTCSKNLLLNLSQDNYYTFESQKGVLKVQYQNGNTYFEKELDPNLDFDWDGKSSNGELKTGLFIYRIEFEGKQTKFGTITIIE
jgi:hypothetical protein